MSVFATILSIDADDDEGKGAPYVYHASHVLPTLDGGRGWRFEVAYVPAVCAGEPVDFLRIDSSPNDDGDPSVTLLLDRKQVLLLRNRLNDWLQRSGPEA